MLALQPGMERLSHEMRDRQVRLHSVSTDLELDLPPNIALPDGEEIPYGSSTRLQIRDPEQESEIYQKCIRPPPNRTVFDGESPPPYRSSSAGLLALGAGAGASDWSSGSSGSHVVRCHSLSSSSSSSASASTSTSSTGGSSSNSRRPHCRHRCPRADRRFRPRCHRPLRRVAHPSPVRVLGSPGRGRCPRQPHHGALPDGGRATVVASAVLHNPLRLPAPAASSAAAAPPPAAASPPPPPPSSPSPPPPAARRQARAVGRRGRGARLTGPSPPSPIVITSLSAVSLGPHCLRE